MENSSSRRNLDLRWALLVLFLWGPALRGQQTTDELRNLARNPVGDAFKVPLTQVVDFDAGPYRRTAASLQLLPIVPLQMTRNWLLTPRIVTTPFAHLPDVTQAKGGSTGMGDTIATFFLTPARTGRLIWGVGPSLLIPTATNTEIGAGKWDVGPAVAVLAQPGWGSFGTVIQNIWSLPTSARRPAVHQMQIETSFSYNLPRGWYLVTSPTISADWTQSGGNRWLVPFGGGVGRTFNIVSQAVDVSLALYSNIVRPSRQFSPKWQMSLQCTLLYPRTSKPVDRTVVPTKNAAVLP